MGKPLMYGGWYPSYHLKVWRRGHGECENRWMDGKSPLARMAVPI